MQEGGQARERGRLRRRLCETLGRVAGPALDAAAPARDLGPEDDVGDGEVLPYE